MSDKDKYYDVKFFDDPSKYFNVSCKYIKESI